MAGHTHCPCFRTQQDFHREPHFITRNVDGDKDASGDDFRVVLKIHYIAYPKAFR